MVNFVGTIVRCRRCRTYINAFVMFTDGGRRWRCNVCSLLNEGGFEVISDFHQSESEWTGVEFSAVELQVDF